MDLIDCLGAVDAYGVPTRVTKSGEQQRRAKRYVGEATVRALPGRLRALSVFHSKSILYGAFVWARRALKHQKRRFPAPRAAACLVHYLVTITKGY